MQHERSLEAGRARGRHERCDAFQGEPSGNDFCPFKPRRPAVESPGDHMSKQGQSKGDKGQQSQKAEEQQPHQVQPPHQQQQPGNEQQSTTAPKQQSGRK